MWKRGLIVAIFLFFSFCTCYAFLPDDLDNTGAAFVSDVSPQPEDNSLSFINTAEKPSEDSLTKSSLESEGFIVEFKDPPLVEKYKEYSPRLAAAQESFAKTSGFERFFISLFGTNPVSRVQKQYERDTASIISNHEETKRAVLQKVSQSNVAVPVSGSTVADSSEGNSFFVQTIASTSSFFIKRLSILGFAVNTQQPVVSSGALREEWTRAFNGISLNINQAQADEIAKMPGVKGVYPNFKLKLFLTDSVPLISTNYTWSRDATGAPCTGDNCLTGKGMTVAVIDSGVDYSNADLGSCTARQMIDKTCEKVKLYDLMQEFH